MDHGQQGRTAVAVHAQCLDFTLQAFVAPPSDCHPLANLWAKRCHIDDFLSLADHALDRSVNADQLLVILLLASY